VRQLAICPLNIVYNAGENRKSKKKINEASLDIDRSPVGMRQ
jgi:hypothetical protein